VPVGDVNGDGVSGGGVSGGDVSGDDVDDVDDDAVSSTGDSVLFERASGNSSDSIISSTSHPEKQRGQSAIYVSKMK
jgi:hypothetical protein